MTLREEVARAMFTAVKRDPPGLEFDEVPPIRNAYMTGADAAIAIVRPIVERETLERAAGIGYLVCAETRHVTIGDKVATAIRALADQAKGEG